MGTAITLPRPNKDGPISLEQAITARRLRRSFLPQALTMEQIGQLSWYGSH
jgi:hypothetical protein